MKRYIINVVLNNHNILESSCQYIVIMEAVVNIIMIVSARSVTAPISDTPLKNEDTDNDKESQDYVTCLLSLQSIS